MNDNNQFNSQPQATPPPASINTVPPETDPIMSPVEPIVTPPKKKRVGLVIGIIIGVLLIGGGIFGLLWYMNHTKPETVALDAMTNLFNSKAVTAEGSIKLSFTEDNDFGVESIKIDLSTESSILPTYSEGTITFLTSGEDEVSINLAQALLADGSMYFKIAGITEVLHATLPAELKAMVDYFQEEIDGLDDQWLELDFVEFAEYFEAEIDTTGYDCTIAALNSLNTDSMRTSFVTGYKENPFAIFEKTDTKRFEGDGYSLGINSDNLEGFLDYLSTDTSIFTDFACGGNTFDTEDVMPAFDNFPDFTFYISNWAHELKGLDVSYENDDITLVGSLGLTFPDSVDVSEPAESLSFTEILENFFTKLIDLSEEDETTDADTDADTDTDTDADTDVDETES